MATLMKLPEARKRLRTWLRREIPGQAHKDRVRREVDQILTGYRVPLEALAADLDMKRPNLGAYLKGRITSRPAARALRRAGCSTCVTCGRVECSGCS